MEDKKQFNDNLPHSLSSDNRQDDKSDRDVLFESSYKSYGEFIDEISTDDLFEGLLGYGMFADKIPPVVTGRFFFEHRHSKENRPSKKGQFNWVTFRYLRNSNIFREFGIPDPFAYELLVRHIVDHWGEIKDLISERTRAQPYRISRIHPRKISGSKAIFAMNYKNWRTDDDPLPTILIGRRYMVKCDISRCFPSIYTHALDWAIEGKCIAKRNKHCGQKNWSSILDTLTAKTTNGETHGLLIGPHTSNLLSELILTEIDRKLFDDGFRFVRDIDDYSCYTDNYEQAEQFPKKLEEYLSEYALSLNQSKTSIDRLPEAIVSSWVRSLKNYLFSEGEVSYGEIQSFLDLAIELAEREKNASVLLYAFRVISGKELTASAKRYYMDMALHLMCIYPYLVPYAEETVFNTANIDKTRVKIFSSTLFTQAIASRDFLTGCYSLYFAAKYKFDLCEVSSASITETDDCLLKLFALIYAKQRNNKELKEILIEHANELKKRDEFGKNWIFIYHALPVDDLSDGLWREIKKAGVKFIDEAALSYDDSDNEKSPSLSNEKQGDSPGKKKR